MVGNGHRSQPLRHQTSTGEQSVEVSDGSRFLRRLRGVGTGGATPDIREPRRLPARQLVLPRRRRRPVPRMGGKQSVP